MIYFIADGFWATAIKAFNIDVKDFNFLNSQELTPDDFINIFDEKGTYKEFNICCEFNFFTSNTKEHFNFSVFNIGMISKDLINLLKNNSKNYKDLMLFKEQIFTINTLISAINNKSSTELDLIFPNKFNNLVTLNTNLEYLSFVIKNLLQNLYTLEQQYKSKDKEIETLQGFLKQLQDRLEQFNDILTQKKELENEVEILSSQVEELNCKSSDYKNIEDKDKEIIASLTNENNSLKKENTELQLKINELLQELNKLKNNTGTSKINTDELQFNISSSKIRKVIYLRCLDEVPHIEAIMSSVMRRVKGSLDNNSYNILTIYPKGSSKLNVNGLSILTKDNYKSYVSTVVDPKDLITLDEKDGIKADGYSITIKDYILNSNIKLLLVLDLTCKEKPIFINSDNVLEFNIIAKKDKISQYCLNEKYTVIYTDKEVDNNILRLPLSDNFESQTELIKYLNKAKQPFIDNFVNRLKEVWS